MTTKNANDNSREYSELELRRIEDLQKKTKAELINIIFDTDNKYREALMNNKLLADTNLHLDLELNTLKAENSNLANEARILKEICNDKERQIDTIKRNYPEYSRMEQAERTIAELKVSLDDVTTEAFKIRQKNNKFRKLLSISLIVNVIVLGCLISSAIFS